MVWACGLWIRCAPSFMLIFLLYLDSWVLEIRAFYAFYFFLRACSDHQQSQNLEGKCAGPHFKITALGCTDCFGGMHCKQSNWGCWRWKMVEINYKQFQKAFTSNLRGHSAAGKATWNCCLIFPSSFWCLISGVLFPSLLLLLPIHALLLTPSLCRRTKTSSEACRQFKATLHHSNPRHILKLTIQR